MHAKDAANSRLRDEPRLSCRGALLRHDHLEHELVGDLRAVARAQVAAIAGVAAEGVLELELDIGVGRAAIARLPAAEERLLADHAGFSARGTAAGGGGLVLVV